MALVLSWLGVALAVACVGAYYVYALGGVVSLEPWLTGRRRSAFAVALALSALPLVARSGGPIDAESCAPLVLTATALGFALWRQWLRLPPARSTSPCSAALDPGTWVVILPGGDATPFSPLAARRVIRVGGVVVVYCSLARTLGAFETGAGLRPTLPLPVGFEVGSAGRRWDGVTGRARDGGADLRRVPIALATYRSWRARFPAGVLYSDRGAAIATAPKHAADLGVVRDGIWTPVTRESVDAAVPEWAGALGGDVAYVGRWVAIARGLAHS